MGGDGAKFRRTLRVIYPLGDSGRRIVLRTERDWSRDVLPEAPEEGGDSFTFTLESERPFLYVKPCLRIGEELRFAPGTNKLILMTEPDERPIYPHFLSAPGGRFAPAIAFDSTRLGREHQIRVYLPPGYSENTLKRYPVLYMQDGQNLFFPEEAFAADWQVDRTVGLLDSMNAIDEFVVVGVYSRDRMAEYTKPGYSAYAESLIGEVKPRIDREFRTMPGPERTGVIGSSLGGVVSFFLAWEWPDVFGGAACLSSTFGHKDDLLERVLSEEKRDARFYLDSGWPEDNYEVTVAMAMALVSRGWVYGRDLLHFAFPLAEHDERSWGLRLHLPLQLFQGAVRNVSNRVQAAAAGAAQDSPPPEV